MKKLIFLSTILFSAFMSGCLKERSNLPTIDPDPNGGGFDFATSKSVTLDVDYNLYEWYDGDKQVEGDRSIFEVYGEDPSGKDGLQPLLRAGMSADGKFSGKLKLPLAVENLWFRTAATGAPQLVSMPLNGGETITMDMSKNFNETTSASRASYSVPGDINLMPAFDWNSLGAPNDAGYNNTQIQVPLVNMINGIFVEGRDLIGAGLGSLIENPAVFVITKNNVFNVVLNFVHSDGFQNNTLAYYTYPQGQEPESPNDVHLTLALPNASFRNAGGDLSCGSTVALNRWDEGQGRYYAGFPAGTCIAFVMLPGAFNDGNIADKAARFYSDPQFNPGGTPQMAAFFNEANGIFVCGVEETPKQGDRDFRDLLFFVKTNVLDLDMQIVPTDPVAPPVDDPENPIATTYTGTLVFEDLWPNRGDYDMNDVVVEYTSTIYTDLYNNVQRIEDSWRPVNCGAQLQNAFAYRYGVSENAVASMNVTTDYAGGAYPGNREVDWSATAKGFEQGQDKAVVMLFDDIRNPSLAGGDYTWNVETTFNPTSPLNRLTVNDIGLPPYNPFIVTLINGEDARNHELHLANYQPTPKASSQWFGKGNDISTPPSTYYISNDNYPFAIDLPVHGFLLPEEMVQKIDDLYPDYHNWATSKGVLNPGWYLNPRQ